MAKSKSLYICSECGYESAKWYGKCPGCGEWNTMNEQVVSVSAGSSKAKRNSGAYAAKVMRLNEISGDIERRISTFINFYNLIINHPEI